MKMVLNIGFVTQGTAESARMDQRIIYAIVGCIRKMKSFKVEWSLEDKGSSTCDGMISQWIG